MSNQTKVMDELESSLVEMTFQYLKIAMPNPTKEQARNLVAKIGTRIMFGADIYDQAQAHDDATKGTEPRREPAEKE